MWKARPDEKPAPGPATPAITPSTVASSSAAPRPVALRPSESFRSEMAHIGKSVLIKGELSGSEDLYLDDEVEGSVPQAMRSPFASATPAIRVFARSMPTTSPRM